MMKPPFVDGVLVRHSGFGGRARQRRRQTDTDGMDAASTPDPLGFLPRNPSSSSIATSGRSRARQGRSDHACGRHREVGAVVVRLAAVNVGDVHLDDRQRNTLSVASSAIEVKLWPAGLITTADAAPIASWVQSIIDPSLFDCRNSTARPSSPSCLVLNR
jgi:hypothetical protein